jgi:hypothetical protein
MAKSSVILGASGTHEQNGGLAKLSKISPLALINLSAAAMAASGALRHPVLLNSQCEAGVSSAKGGDALSVFKKTAKNAINRRRIWIIIIVVNRLNIE